MSGLLLAVLALISGGQRYTDDDVTTEPIGGGGGFGGGGGGVRNGEPPTYVVVEPIGISKVSKAKIIYSTTLPAAGVVEPTDTGDINVITPIGDDKYIKTVIPKASLGDDVWRDEEPVYKGKYKVL